MTDMEHRPLNRIVVGVDGSSTSDQALRWAANRVSPSGTLHVVHASDDRARTDGEAPTPDWLERARAEWECPAETTVEVVVGEGATALIETAARVEAEAIVVGAHGMGRPRTPVPFIGNVTRTLVERSGLPLIVHHGPTTGVSGPIISGVGYGRPAEAAVSWAAAYAQAGGSPLRLVHAVSNRPLFPIDSPVDMIGSYLGGDLDRSWAEEDLHSLADELTAAWPGLTVSATVARGSAVRSLLSAAGGAELLVLGRWDGPGTRRLPISPRLRQLIARAPCPTAIVPTCPRAT